MGQSKFEKDIREVLEKRTIVPSVDAWDKLDARLNEQPKKTKLSPYYWLVASVVILLTISILFFGLSNEIAPQIVEINDEEKNVEKNNVIFEPEVIEQNKEEIIVVNNEKEKEIDKRDLIEKESFIVREDHIIDTNAIENKFEITEIQAITFEEQKVNEVVEIIQAIQLERETTDEEIDLLLAQAQQEIDAQKRLDKNIGKVDAMALLIDVEGELDKTFKDKVLDILKDKVIQVVENKKN